jgi:hypothetical protein
VRVNKHLESGFCGRWLTVWQGGNTGPVGSRARSLLGEARLDRLGRSETSKSEERGYTGERGSISGGADSVLKDRSAKMFDFFDYFFKRGLALETA